MDEIITELDQVVFGDKRLSERSKKILNDLYQNINTGLTGSFSTNNDLISAYRFLINLVNPSKILSMHKINTIEGSPKQVVI